MEKHVVSQENASKFLDWIRTRGGLAIWCSVNMSNPGASWTTPVLNQDGTPVTKPIWEADTKPARVITDTSEVEVVTYKEVEQFRVTIRRGGLLFKCSDTSSRKIRDALARAGKGSVYHFDYETQRAVISVPDKSVPLDQWEPDKNFGRVNPDF